MDAITMHLRRALRSLARSPGFTLVAVLTLALGIGANTALFSAVDSLLLHPLPFPGGERMVQVWQTNPKGGMSTSPMTEVTEAWKGAHSFEGAEPFSGRRVLLRKGEGTEYGSAMLVTPSFLSFLGERPALGRGFSAEEAKAGGPRVAMLSYGVWKDRYGGDPAVLGRTIPIDGKPYTVVGVMPPSVTELGLSGRTDVWLPLRDDEREDGGVPTTNLWARLRPGVGAAAAEGELNDIRSRLTESVPFFEGWKAKLRRPQDFLEGSLATALRVLLGAVGLVLLVACANVAGLLLARGTERRREMAIRSALGAGRGALIRQLLTESVVLSLLGGALGVLLARWGVAAVGGLRPESLAALDHVGVDRRALLFTLAVSVATGLLFGLVPALRASSVRPGEELKAGGHGSIGRAGGGRLRAALVAGEVALSVVLLIGAGLLIRTLSGLAHVDPGFRTEGLVVARLELPTERYREAAAFDALARAIRERAEALPGVTDAVLTGEIPLHYGAQIGDLQVEGRSAPAELQGTVRALGRVPSGYFAVTGVPLVSGREFSDAERSWDDHVVVLGEHLARQLAPDGRAVGLRIRFSDDGPWSTVIGVASDVAANGLRQLNTPQQLYVPYSGVNAMGGQTWLAVRTTGDPARTAALLRSLAHSVDAEIPVPEVTTGEGLVREELREPRFYGLLLGGFATLALLLAAVGLFGVLSFAVRQRTREIGIRLALGARAPRVLTLVVRQGMTAALVGLAAGLALSLAATRLMGSLLFQVRPNDPATFVLVAGLTLLVAFLASWLPARRASRVDPIVALRAE
jgi:predicted permease